jgi:hypothetical protein
MKTSRKQVQYNNKIITIDYAHHSTRRPNIHGMLKVIGGCSMKIQDSHSYRLLEDLAERNLVGSALKRSPRQLREISEIKQNIEYDPENDTWTLVLIGKAVYRN